MFVQHCILALALVTLVRSAAVPITKCTAEDTKCLKDNTAVLIPLFTAGIPELGVERLDPVFYKEINSSSNTLQLIFTDTTIKGLSTCKFKKLTRDPAKMLLSAKIHCNIELDGNYDMNGRIIVLPIQGNGKVHIEHQKMEIGLELHYKEVTGADGKKHWDTAKWKHTFDYKGKTKMTFDNLFGGNEVLGRAAREVIDNNANDLAKETAGPIIKVITARIVKSIKNFFEKVPVEELVIE